MEYQIAICDDSEADRTYLAGLVRQWMNQTGHTAQLSAFSSAENFLFQYEEKKDYDILLLDIEMGDMDGVTLARKLRKDNDTLQIIFITGYSDYIAEGYEVAALHYLMKPLKEEKFFSVLDRAAARLQKIEKVLHLTTGGEMVRVPIYRIRYAEVTGNYITIHGKEEFTLKMPLAELEKKLDHRFYRAGRSLLVNLTQISRVTRTEIHLSDGTVLPLPRGAYEGINRAIIDLEE